MNLEEVKGKFKNHVLQEWEVTDKIKVFHFKNSDGSSMYWQKWIIDGGRLIVVGDCYSAVYHWGSAPLTLEFLAECDLWYFSKKCCADKDGHHQQVFCENTANESLKECAVEAVYSMNESTLLEDYPNWDELDLEKRYEITKPFMKRKLSDIEEDQELLDKIFDHDSGDVDRLFCCQSEEEVANAYYSRQDLFGDSDIETKRYTPTPYFHLAALKVAFEKYPNAF